MAREGFHLSSSSHYNFLCRVLLIYHNSKGLTRVQKVHAVAHLSSQLPAYSKYQSYFSSLPDQMLFHNQQIRHTDSLYTALMPVSRIILRMHSNKKISFISITLTMTWIPAGFMCSQNSNGAEADHKKIALHQPSQNKWDKDASEWQIAAAVALIRLINLRYIQFVLILSIFS